MTTKKQSDYKDLPIKYGFTKKAETQGRRAKIHFLDINNKSKCNPHLDISEHDSYNGKIGDLFIEDICKTCHKIISKTSLAKRSCWGCKNKEVLWISEKILCDIPENGIVYPWEAERCLHFEEDNNV
jgi:hypothetical protein